MCVGVFRCECVSVSVGVRFVECVSVWSVLVCRCVSVCVYVCVRDCVSVRVGVCVPV